MTSSMHAALMGALLLVACDDSPEATPAPPTEPPEARAPENTEPPALPEPVPVEPSEEGRRAAPLAPTLVEREGIHLTRLVTTAELVGHGPGEPQRVFTKGVDERAYCYFELDNPDERATRVTLTWVDPSGESPNPPSTIEVPAQGHFANYRYTGVANRRLGELACLIQLDGREQLGRAPIRVVE